MTDIAAPPVRPKQKRLSSEERRRDILEKAIRFFALNGMASSTRDLARELGITQPLLYRYFPSKDALIQEVYEAVYLDRWNPDWDDIICDRSRPLRDRLIHFYDEYTDAIFEPEWLRIYLYSGLMGEEINRNYVNFIGQKILNRIVREYHIERGRPANGVSDKEMELVWNMQGGIFYHGVREVVFKAPVPLDKHSAIATAVDTFLIGLDAQLPEAS
jgi:AcrR family transcriptional regulator